MSYVGDNLSDIDGVLTCTKCETPVGPVEEGVEANAGTFDLSLDVGQSAEISPGTSRYVLRHYACRACGALFEVDMTAVAEETA